MTSSTSPRRRESKDLLREVRISEQVVHSCLRHAFTTEREEVMGLLLGRIEVTAYGGGGSAAALGEPANGAASSSTGGVSNGSPALPVRSKVVHIWGTHVSERNVQRSDRVEMSPESLASASEEADRIAAETGVRTYVVGWYHSHPRITVAPSIIDLGTQLNFQQHVESGWVGLIASVFHAEAATQRSYSALHSFQSGPSKEYVKVPMTVVPQSEFFPTTRPIAALTDTAPRLLEVLRQEVRNAVDATERATGGDAAASHAARGLAALQLFEVDRLVAEPTRKELELCSLPALRVEVARLEQALAQAKK